ncbi:MMPL family transporter [Paraflavitalea sp. CAU 1676]|uniref:efflux RND transporter permease subunit n=1 Tax=Paraflavitalea sp. CAU 1676 TaxID=3032598 RepID=UPI0023D9B3FE|nr:MMPL family transporter [Paraflavitalea sp. CAU 1676]MDF2187135.1 MMPL family transporter [Paraflavitalea sp. CAU 1676]
MWGTLARFIIRFRWLLLVLLLAVTAFLGYHASKVQLSYEFTRAIPTDNPKYLTYQAFRQQFGEDGNLLVVGVQTDQFFTEKVFNDYVKLAGDMKKVEAVEDVLSVPVATNLMRDTAAEKLHAAPLFPTGSLSQSTIDTCAATFRNLPFYQGLLYNPATNTYLMGIRINKDVLNSKKRNDVVAKIVEVGDAFGKQHSIDMHYSGLPLIRTNIATKVAREMQWFLLGSILLSAVLLLICFRSFSAMSLSLAVVIIGVLWSLGTMVLYGYKITILNALIPPLVVVIGIPNCIYFLNKFHTAWHDTDPSLDPATRKRTALTEMISRMGVVTLFCNIAAAIGFGVFALTKSAVLKEFGVVAGINIMALFFISVIFIPVVLSFLPAPKPRHTRYLDNKWLLKVLDKLEIWSVGHRKMIYGVTAVILVISVVGIFRLKSEGYMVDDLPKTDKIYTDLKFFEKNFKGIMPLEIVIDTKRKNGLRANMLQTFGKIDTLSAYIAAQPEMARPLSIVEGLKFARQAYYEGDSLQYGLPNSFDIGFLAQYLGGKSEDSTGKQNNFSRVVRSFMDSTRQRTRISVNMADVGSKRLPELISAIQSKSDQLFDTARYKVEYTGTTVTFLEGSAFIINGLKESIAWAFLLIALCMLYLFRSVKILLCSLVPNIIPLIITAGVMGWTGVAIKPSTVLVFSVALGIAVDITIRFLVNYKQELQRQDKPAQEIVIDTIHKTGISIIYTSLVLIAGFVIFCFSGFGGTQALGWLTSLTLVLATLTNLIFLPTLLMSFVKKERK